MVRNFNADICKKDKTCCANNRPDVALTAAFLPAFSAAGKSMKERFITKSSSVNLVFCAKYRNHKAGGKVVRENYGTRRIRAPAGSDIGTRRD